MFKNSQEPYIVYIVSVARLLNFLNHNQLFLLFPYLKIILQIYQNEKIKQGSYPHGNIVPGN